jgi:2C-methyl-D-erythritol 2,4-cyclodiphosphate synthase
MSEYRIGQGYDVHRLAEGRRLILGGWTSPGRRGFWAIRTPMCCSTP